VLREAARRIRDGGRIINISSSTTAYPQAGYAMYAASKVSSSMITQILAAGLGPRDITSNSLIVGPVASGFLSGDGAAVAAFLARPEASWINGQLLTVNGGAMI
jgi:3-oxoacyl-[acyl-carrier protein] reductase